MASYTMQLREYIEHATQFKDGLSIREKIEEGRKLLFDFNYPIFDESYRRVFETNFIRRFYMREIGFETEELFKFNLETWLNIHMPYYNQLFESEQLRFDPLINSNVERIYQKDNKANQSQERKSDSNSTMDGTASSTAKETSKSDGSVKDDRFNRDLESTTPDSRLAITTNDGSGVIEYASKIEEEKEKLDRTIKNTGSNDTTTNDQSNVKSNSNANETAKANADELESYIERRGGKIGVQSYSKMLMEYRESFLRIEHQIHKEMNELFMLVY